MSQRVILNPAVKHIVDNLNIFGFGSEESALLQSVKELLENSIDACRSSMSLSSPTAKRISISIKDVDSVSCALEVSDDGSGVAEALSVLKVFNSSKDGSNPNDTNPFATGRFGVGLSTCLVYSLDKCGAAMRMVTKCKEQSHATIADYSMDRTGQPQCVQSRSVNTGDFVSGTRIRVVLPLQRDRVAIVQKVCRAMGMYLVVLDCLPHSYFQIGKADLFELHDYLPMLTTVDFTDLQASVDGYTNSVQTSGHTFTPYTSIIPATPIPIATPTTTSGSTVIHNAITNPTASTPVTTTTMSTTHTTDTTVSTDPTHTAYAQSYIKYLVGTAQQICCSATAEVQGQNEEVTVVVELILTEATGNLDTSVPLTASTADTAIPLTVHRYVNHTPLLDYHQDALSCGIVNSLRTVKWAQYGYKLKMSSKNNSSSDRGGVCLNTTCQETMQAANDTTAGQDDTSPTTPAAASNDNNSPSNNNNTLWQSPVCELVCTRPELCDAIQRKHIQLVLAVDVICRKVPYANMRKTSLSGDCSVIQALVAAGVHTALAKVEQVDDAPGLFVSKREYKERLMLQRYLPSIANSVAAMVMLSKDEEYVERVQELLDINITNGTDGNSNNIDNNSTGNNSDGSDHIVNGRNRTKAVLADCIQQKLRDLVLRR